MSSLSDLVTVKQQSNRKCVFIVSAYVCVVEGVIVVLWHLSSLSILDRCLIMAACVQAACLHVRVLTSFRTI